MSESDIRKPMAMLVDPKITKKEAAEHFAVSRTTLTLLFNGWPSQWNEIEHKYLFSRHDAFY
jgi:hypothetical protein